MEKDVKQVVGLEKGINKKYNTPFTVLHTVCDFDSYFVQNRGAIGKKVEVTYIRGNISVELGDTVRFVYNRGFNGEAVVVDVLVVG